MAVDKTLAITIYRQAKLFGQRPYTYICPKLQNPQYQFNVDSAIYLIGVREEERLQEEAERKTAMELKKKGKRKSK